MGSSVPTCLLLRRRFHLRDGVVDLVFEEIQSNFDNRARNACMVRIRLNGELRNSPEDR